MMNLTYEEIVEKIKKEKGLTDEEISKRVKEKLDLLSDLISKEGAAHIIANELGVKVFENISRKNLKINDLLNGLRSVNIVGKVITIYEVREFRNIKRAGKVGSFLIGDESGVIRVVLWDTDHIKEIENGNIKEGTIIKIRNGYTKDNNGFKELHLGGQGQLIINPEGEEIGEIKIKGNKKEIKDLKENDRVSIIGTVVQAFEPRFYEICPECGKRLILEGEKFVCSEHKIVKEKLVPVVTLFFDDGSDNIRVVAFRDLANKLFNVNLIELKDDPEKFEELRTEILGKQLEIIGRVNKNELFDRLEFVAQDIKEVDPEKLAEQLVKEIDV